MWTENSFKITWTFSGDIRVNFKRPVWIWFYSYFSLRFLNGHITSFEKLCYGSQRNLDAMGAREALYWCNQGYRVKEILISWKSVFFTLWWRENFKEKKNHSRQNNIYNFRNTLYNELYQSRQNMNFKTFYVKCHKSFVYLTNTGLPSSSYKI